MKLLKELLEAYGPSGNEKDVRTIIHKEIKKYVTDIHIDDMGNLIAHKKGSKPSVMLAAHMDEVGLMVKRIDSSGLIYVTDIGGILIDALVGQRVSIKTRKGYIRGVISTMESSAGKELKTLPTIEDFFVDTGLSKKDLDHLGIRIGSYVNLEGEAIHLGSEDILAGKALDDRIGCYMLLELAKKTQKTPYEIFYVFTVQEEIGLYGAKTSAFQVHPDMGIAVEVTHANDLFEHSSRGLGMGPCITIKDGGFISNKCINDAIIDLAAKYKIPCQLEATEIGTTDATTISVSRGGVPSTVVSVPIRNIHSTISIAHRRDIENTIRLLELVLKNPPKHCLV